MLFLTLKPQVKQTSMLQARYKSCTTSSYVQVSAVWHNMREEPVIYINGRPFVLREDERPFKNMQEYTGIDVRRLEQMELRLKNDILQVLPSYGKPKTGRSP